MKAVILAAGIGSRLGELGKRIPKCLIEIGGKTLLERQIMLLNESGIDSENIVVVVGGMGDVWNEENKEKIKKIHENIVINDKNIELHSSYSFWLAVKDIDDDILCMDGDLLFNKEVLNNLVNNDGSLLLTRNISRFREGNHVLSEMNKVLEFGPSAKSDSVYIGLGIFDRCFVNALKMELSNGEYFNSSLAGPIDKVCKSCELINFDVDKNNLSDKEPKIINVNTIEEYESAKKIFS